MNLIAQKPSLQLLPSYLEAIQEGHYRNMALGFGDDSFEQIVQDPDAYLTKIQDPVSWKVKLPDGSAFDVTDHALFWITDGARFIGSLPFRFACDVELLENYCGHVGLAIRPSLLNIGYGVKALNLAREIARSKKLEFILATCDPNNSASKRLIEHSGGTLYRSNSDFHGSGPNLIYRIESNLSND